MSEKLMPGGHESLKRDMGSAWERREKFVSPEPVGGNHPPIQDAEGFVTIQFDTDDTYARFVDYIFDELGGRGIELSDAPIATSARVRRSVLQQIPDELRQTARPVTKANVERILREDKGEDLLDPAPLKRFHFARK